jgi:hypothetical protein
MNFKIATRALTGSILVLALALFFSASASAQSNSTGNIAGHATAGDVVTIRNPKTGFSRTITVGEKGSFRAGSLPLATYVVTIQHADGTVYLEKSATVRVGLTIQIK